MLSRTRRFASLRVRARGSALSLFSRATAHSHLNVSAASGPISTRSYYNSSSDSDDEDDDRKKRPTKALVLGSSGALGSYLCKYFSTQLQIEVLGADVLELPQELTGEWQLDAFCALSKDATLEEMTVQLTESVYDFLQESNNNNNNPNANPNANFRGLDCLIVAAGGFQMDPAALKPVAPGEALSREQYLQQASDQATNAQRMLRQNTYPVLAASSIARHFMNPKGSLMVVIGAAAALGPTPGMLHYGTSKAAAHHIAQTLGSCTGNNFTETKSIQKQAKRVRQHLPGLDHLSVVSFLPSTLDTPANRKATPEATDRIKWTSIPTLAQEIGKLLTTPQLRPHSGSLVKIYDRKPEAADMVSTSENDSEAFLELVR